MMLVATLVVALLTLVSLPRVSSLPFSNASPRAPHLVPHESLRTFDRRLGGADNEDKDVIDLCREFYYDSIVDHFSWSAGGERYKQRVFICDVYWKDRTLQKYEEEPSNSDGKSRKGPIFFYTGNEADVTLYLNETGFMWEFAQEVGALLVFAEHRYYGKSNPFGKDDMSNLQYLTSEQALADYAELIEYIKQDLGAIESPVITFGGSYGGMLSTWFRMKYPHIVDGAFAASAPIWSFLGEFPPYDAGSFAKVVTYDATQEAGASVYCATNVRKSWDVAMNISATSEGRKQVAEAFQLCDGVPLDSSSMVTELLDWAQTAFDYMSMGNYPYPSSYMLNGKGSLPAFPMRVACEHMKDANMSDNALLQGLAQAVSVWYNYTDDLSCLDYRKGVNPETQNVGELWDYQFCTEMFMPMSRDGINDMFFPQPFDYGYAIEDCKRRWGVEPRPYWITITYGGKDISDYSNIIFSNGEYDPWKGGGVLKNITDSLHAVYIDGGAHHLDFMWSTKQDPQAVLQARSQERSIINKWISDAYEKKGRRRASPTTS